MNIKNLKKIIRWMKIWLFQFCIIRLKNQRPDGKASGIVIIKIDAIGDFLIWLDSATQYRNIYPHEKITLVCNTACGEIAEKTGLFDEVITVKPKIFEVDKKYRRRIIDMLEKKQYKVLLQPAYSRTISMDIMASYIQAERKIGFVADESRENLGRFLANRKIKKKADKIYDQLISAGEGCFMELERNAIFIRKLGYNYEIGYPQLPVFEVRTDIIPKTPYAVIFPGASTSKKMWPIERFAEVGKYLIYNKKLDVCLCGAKEEAYLFDSFMNAIQSTDLEQKVHNYFGRTTLIELAEVIRHADVLIGNDTSGIHFAAAVNTKGICIAGEFSYGRFLPYVCEKNHAEHNPIIVCHSGMPCAGCSNGRITTECKRYTLETGRHLCIEKVTIEQVIAQI